MFTVRKAPGRRVERERAMASSLTPEHSLWSRTLVSSLTSNTPSRRGRTLDSSLTSTASLSTVDPMFTGIVEQLGTVISVRSGPRGGCRLRIGHAFGEDGVRDGDSVCTDGVCLTATEVEPGAFTVDAGPETLDRTTIGGLAEGDPVNLERSVTLQTRLGGHLVMGHVDAVGRLTQVEARENAWDLQVAVPVEVARLAIVRGSVAVQGVSLTVTGQAADAFSVSIIPHTWAVTTLSRVSTGTPVNVECDVIARYVQGLLEPIGKDRSGVTAEFLKAHGF